MSSLRWNKAPPGVATTNFIENDLFDDHIYSGEQAKPAPKSTPAPTCYINPQLNPNSKSKKPAPSIYEVLRQEHAAILEQTRQEQRKRENRPIKRTYLGFEYRESPAEDDYFRSVGMGDRYKRKSNSRGKREDEEEKEEGEQEQTDRFNDSWLERDSYLYGYCYEENKVEEEAQRKVEQLRSQAGAAR